MFEPKYIRENLKAFRETLEKKKIAADLNLILKLDEERLNLLGKIEKLRAERNRLGREDQERGSEIKLELKNFEPQLKTLEERLNAELLKVPNLLHPGAPVGASEKENKVLRTVGKPAIFPFPPKDHEQIANQLGLIDLEWGSKVAGSKFYFLQNEAVLLELGLGRYVFDFLGKEGFKFFITPDLAKKEIISGLGFNPRGPQSDVYTVEGEDLGLIGTAEITLGGYHANEVLDSLPLKYAGLSHCFRREAGTYGKSSQGLYRVHQFSKVEMFIFCRPAESEKMHAYLLGLEEKIFQGLKIPYRIVDVCSGEIGAPYIRKFDLEAWMPGRNGGTWGEVTSTSNATDYQARRLGIKYRTKDGGKNDYVHTINGTAIAISRALIAILENYQQKDGTVKVPKVLAPYVGKEVISGK